MEEYTAEQRKKRATLILENYQLLIKYALENQQVSYFQDNTMQETLTSRQSVPATRVYFEKVAAGDTPTPIIKNWFTLSR